MNTRITFASAIICAATFLFQLSAQAKLYGPKRYETEGFLFYTGGELFQSKQNFNSNGKETSLSASPVNGVEYILLDVPVGARYLILPNLGIEGEVKAGFAQSKSKDLINAGTRSSTNIHEARISGDFLVELGNFDLIPEVEAQFAFKNIDAGTDSVMMDEGTSIFSGLVHVQTEFNAIELFGHLGYTGRGDGRSSLLPWSAGLGWNTEQQLFGARVFGFQSISDDKDKKSPGIRESVINKVNGGSMKFYSVNPSVVSVEGLWTFRSRGTWGLQAHVGLDVAGENYAKGIFAGANFTMEIGSSNFTQRSRSLRSERRARRAGGSGMGSGSAPAEPGSVDFKEDIKESNDQQYFQAEPVKRPAPKPVRRAKPAQPSDQQIQNQMDDVEMQIEMKRKKRK